MSNGLFAVVKHSFNTETGKSDRAVVKRYVSHGAASNFASTKNHASGGSIVGDAKVEKVITSYAVEPQ